MRKTAYITSNSGTQYEEATTLDFPVAWVILLDSLLQCLLLSCDWGPCAALFDGCETVRSSGLAMTWLSWLLYVACFFFDLPYTLSVRPTRRFREFIPRYLHKSTCCNCHCWMWCCLLLGCCFVHPHLQLLQPICDKREHAEICLCHPPRSTVECVQRSFKLRQWLSTSWWDCRASDRDDRRV